MEKHRSIFVISIGILLAIAAIGIIAGLASWLLKYGLLALGIYVIFVLTLRWLHGGDKRRKVSGAPDVERFNRPHGRRTRSSRSSTRSRRWPGSRRST